MRIRGTGWAAVALATALAVFSAGAATAEFQWWHQMIGATETNQNALNNGAGVTVGVLDTRSEAGHSAFAGRLADFPVAGGVYEYTFFDGLHRFLDLGGGPPGSRVFFDPNLSGSWHGTHVAGIVGAARDGIGMVGVAPQASIVNAGVLDTLNLRQRPVSLMPPTLMRDALTFVANQGASVSNMSIGFSVPLLANDDMLQGISLNRHRLVVAKAAGNSGQPLFSQTWDTSANPLDNLLIVGAVDSQGQIATFSNRPGNGCFLQPGSSTCRDEDRFRHRFLVAPGVGIMSAVPTDFGFPMDVGVASGTSMAAPMVAGAAALLQSRWPFLKSDPAATANILLDTANRSGHLGNAQVYGRGLLDLTAAMQAQGTPMVAVGADVGGPGYASADSLIQLSPVLGGGSAVLRALDGIVIFDRYGRDFEIDPGSLVVTPSRAPLLGGFFRSGFDSGQHSLFASLPLSAGLVTISTSMRRSDVLSAAVPQALQRSSDALQHEGNPAWRIGGHQGAWRFSAGQYVKPETDLASSTSGELFVFPSGEPLQPLLGLAEPRLYGAFRYRIASGFGAGAGFVSTRVADEHLDPLGSGRAYFVKFDVKPLAGLGLETTHMVLAEDKMVLGGHSRGALAVGAGAQTWGQGVAASVDLTPSLTARFHVAEAETEVTSGAPSLFRGVRTVRSRGYGASIRKTGVFQKDDALGFSVSRPLRVHAGSAVLDTPVGRTVDGTVIYRRSQVALAPEGAQTDFELAYGIFAMPNLSVGINLFYQHQLNHTPRAWNGGALSRLRMTF